MNPLLAILAQQMNENLGNRLTPAVANGIILAIRQELDRQEEAAKAPPAESKTEQPNDGEGLQS